MNTIQLSKRRWLNLSLFIASRILQEAIWVNYSPIATNVSQWYSISITLVNSLAFSWLLCYIPLAPVSSFILQKYSIRATQLIAVIALFIGTIIKSVGGIYSQFWLLWIGQFICSICMVFTFQNSPSMSNTWFSENERTVATACGFLAGPIGNMIAFIATPYIVINRRILVIMEMIECAIAMIIMVITALFFKATPDHLPSKSQAYTATATTTTLKSKMRTILSSKTCWLLFIVISTQYAIDNTFCIILEQQFSSYYTSKEIGIASALMILGIVIGTLTSAVIVDNTKWFKATILFSCVVSLIANSAFTVACVIEIPLFIFIIIMMLYGAAVMSVTTVGFETVAECTYPIPPIYAITIFSVAGCPFIIILIVVAGLVSKFALSCIFWGLLIMSLLATLIMKPEYKRTNADTIE